MELKNINEVNASEVLLLAAASLWDGVTLPLGGADRFCCLAVTTAIEKITGLSWSEADDSALAVKLRNNILDRLDGHCTVDGYLRAKRGLGCDDIASMEAQAYRKVLLGKLADEYAEKERKDQIAEQIRILEEVRVLRSGNSYFSNFVCWNIDAVMKEKTTPAVRAIKQDIDQYIDGETTVRCWLETRDRRYYENDDPVVLNARMKLVDDLLARYREELAA